MTLQALRNEVRKILSINNILETLDKPLMKFYLELHSTKQIWKPWTMRFVGYTEWIFWQFLIQFLGWHCAADFSFVICNAVNCGISFSSNSFEWRQQPWHIKPICIASYKKQWVRTYVFCVLLQLFKSLKWGQGGATVDFAVSFSYHVSEPVRRPHFLMKPKTKMCRVFCRV